MKNLIIISSSVLLFSFNRICGQSTTAGNVLTGTQSAPLQYLGSSNNFDLVFRTNNVERMRILAGTTGTIPGNVGIGTIAPTAKLHIDAGDRTGLTVNTTHATSYSYGILSIVNNDNSKGIALSKSGTDKFIAWGNGNTYISGNAGIGTSDMTNRLTLSGGNVIHKTSGGAAILFSCNDGGTYDQRVGIGTVTPNAKLHIETTSTGLVINSMQSAPYGYAAIINVQQDLTKALVVEKNGNDNFLVYGNGTVYAREVNVKLGALGDFVFDADYKLNSLKDVEEFIIEHKHLPGMPNAKEVADNGLQIGEFQNLLLQKVEELTLYIIQLEKNNKQLTEKIELYDKNR